MTSYISMSCSAHGSAEIGKTSRLVDTLSHRHHHQQQQQVRGGAYRCTDVNLVGWGGAQAPFGFAIAPPPQDFPCLIFNIVGMIT